MIIGVISDTHGDVYSAREAVRIFQSLEGRQDEGGYDEEPVWEV